MTKLSSGAVPRAQETYVRTGTESDVDDIYVDGVATEGSPGVATEPDAGPSDRRPRPSHRHARSVRAAVAVADAVAAALALVLGGSIDAVSVPPSVAAMSGALAWVGLLVSFGAYAIGAGAPVRAILGAGGVAGVLLVVVAGSPPRSLLLTLVTLVVTALLARIAAGRFQRRARANGSLRLRTAIVDAGGGAPTLDGVLSGDTDMTPVIRIDLTAPPGRAPRHDAIPTADVNIHAVPRLLAEHAVGCLLVVGTLQHGELETLRRAARQAGAEFRVAIAVPEVPIGRVSAASAGRAAVVSVSTPSTFGAGFVKRLMDLTVASLLIVLTFPLLTVIAVAIKVSSPGPVMFRQWRVTRGGRPFRIFKFRTMDASRDHGSETSTAQPFFKLEDDPRLTSIGRVIRRLSLDELPQLLNVVLGDMSLVGPRPLPIEQVRAHPELLRPRNDVRAGMTGWWQVNGRSDLPPEEAVGHDLYYIENWSLAFDVRILAKTIPAIFSQRGAY